MMVRVRLLRALRASEANHAITAAAAPHGIAIFQFTSSEDWFFAVAAMAVRIIAAREVAIACFWERPR